MGDWYLGEIRLFPYNLIPANWVRCEGQILPINQNQALFSLLNNNYGGNGINNFALPDLRGRVATGLWRRATDESRIFSNKLGAATGEEVHKLTNDELPSHNHLAQGNTDIGTSAGVAGNVWAAGTEIQKIYDVLPTSPVTMDAGAISSTGSNAGHNNMQPFSVLNYCIAVVGLYPPRAD